MDVTLIEESRGDKSIPVVTLAKLQANTDLTLVLHFGYLHGVTLVSVQAVCKAGYFSFVHSLLCTFLCIRHLLAMSETFNYFFCGTSHVTQGKHILFHVHFLTERSAFLSLQ